MIFPLFWLIYINFFFLNYVEHVFVNSEEMYSNNNDNDWCQKFPGKTF